MLDNYDLDYSLEICLNGIWERRGKVRTDMPWIENEDEEDLVEINKKFVGVSIDEIKKHLNCC